MSWLRDYTVHTTATPTQMWQRWTDATTWAVDDPGVEWALFDGTPRTGSTGRVKNHGTPAQKFVFTTVEHERQMDFTITLPGARLTIAHLMEPSPGGLGVTHGIRFDGVLARAYGTLIGRGMAAQLPDVVRAVVAGALGEPAKRG